MKTRDHLNAHVIGRPTTGVSAVRRSSFAEASRPPIKHLLIATCLATAVAVPAWATQLPVEAVSQSGGNMTMRTDATADPSAGPSNARTASFTGGQDADGAIERESAAHATWRAQMAQNSTPEEGCFRASYPNLVWEKVECTVVLSGVHPVRIMPTDSAGEVTGNGRDWVALAKGLITGSMGGFSIKGVKSEKGVGVAAFGGGGVLGKNEYSLQVNTNANETTSKCAGHSGCRVWQQFVYATDALGKGQAALFIQYWLIDWGSSACPRGWGQFGASCFTNSTAILAPDVPITGLQQLTLEGTATPGGHDSVVLGYGVNTYSITAKDSVLDISSVWRETEFNVVGNAGGSRAVFNKGSSIIVTVVLTDGSNAAPTCILNGGTTGESNNMNLGSCKALSGKPTIQFIEAN
jgi:hypothetical protein